MMLFTIRCLYIAVCELLKVLFKGVGYSILYMYVYIVINQRQTTTNDITKAIQAICEVLDHNHQIIDKVSHRRFHYAQGMWVSVSL